MLDHVGQLTAPGQGNSSLGGAYRTLSQLPLSLGSTTNCCPIAQLNNINKADVIQGIFPNMQLLSDFNYNVWGNVCCKPKGCVVPVFLKEDSEDSQTTP